MAEAEPAAFAGRSDATRELPRLAGARGGGNDETGTGPTQLATSARYGASPIRGKRILYVDDNPSVRRSTSGLLRDAGAICLLAGTHEQAVTLAGSEPELALAILDFQMPDGDVGGLVARLRTTRTALPLIGTSGTDHRDDFAERGVTQFLEKPWQLGDLVRCFEFALSANGPPGRGRRSDEPLPITFR